MLYKLVGPNSKSCELEIHAALARIVSIKLERGQKYAYLRLQLESLQIPGQENDLISGNFEVEVESTSKHFDDLISTYDGDILFLQGLKSVGNHMKKFQFDLTHRVVSIEGEGRLSYNLNCLESILQSPAFYTPQTLSSLPSPFFVGLVTVLRVDERSVSQFHQTCCRKCTNEFCSFCNRSLLPEEVAIAKQVTMLLDDGSSSIIAEVRPSCWQQLKLLGSVSLVGLELLVLLNCTSNEVRLDLAAIIPYRQRIDHLLLELTSK